ncbi:hypothetical protein BJY01DRAFT_248340 [Aspergillus pseudoustus]|uniref:Uncharacterized protein n=1 Tax=Aspergillus pseudoustus TaxID=1810923 RepID=A0ABR4JVP6_9EURO
MQSLPIPNQCPRRIVTGHDDDGRSIVLKNSPIDPTPTEGFQAKVAVLWKTDEFPVDNDRQDAVTDVQHWPLVPENGVAIRVVDFPPNTSTVMHRTISLDYGILMAGEIDLYVDTQLRQLNKHSLIYSSNLAANWTSKSST